MDINCSSSKFIKFAQSLSPDLGRLLIDCYRSEWYYINLLVSYNNTNAKPDCIGSVNTGFFYFIRNNHTRFQTALKYANNGQVEIRTWSGTAPNVSLRITHHCEAMKALKETLQSQIDIFSKVLINEAMILEYWAEFNKNN